MFRREEIPQSPVHTYMFPSSALTTKILGGSNRPLRSDSRHVAINNADSETGHARHGYVGGSFTRSVGRLQTLCMANLKLHMVHGPKVDLPGDRRWGLEKGGYKNSNRVFAFRKSLDLWDAFYPHETEIIFFV